MIGLFQRSAAFAIGWELWIRNRTGAIVLGVLLLSAGGINWTLLRNNPWSEVAALAGYILLVAALFAVFCFSHFTEGRRKGGFGSFPQRLFNLPVATSWLVALPMIYGSLAVLCVYLTAAWLIFWPLGKSLLLLWPSLYLVAALALFQTIVWSIPDRRYLKILCLSLGATVICVGWMFFLPHVIDGTLEELGYQGSVRSFQIKLMTGLALAGPAAYSISLWRIHQQRHAGGRHSGRVVALHEWVSNHLFVRARPFRSARHAVLSHEWRRHGFILPIAVAAILGMTCLPAWLSGPLSGKGTVGVLSWVLLSPMVLALIIGCGFAKFDFWNTDLKMPQFAAVRPFSPGKWVVTKLQVALGSVILTWLLVLLVSFLFLAYAGDPGGLDRLYWELKIHYSPVTRWLVGALTLFAAMTLTWRFLIGGLAIGLSANRVWYYTANSVCASVLATALLLLIWRGDRADHPLHLYQLWPGIVRLPFLLALVVFAKALVAAWAWTRVLRNDLLEGRAIATYFCAWTIATVLISAGMSIAFPHTPWLRHTLTLLALLVVPLAGPALAILALLRNRSST